MNNTWSYVVYIGGLSLSWELDSIVLYDHPAQKSINAPIYMRAIKISQQSNHLYSVLISGGVNYWHLKSTDNLIP